MQKFFQVFYDINIKLHPGKLFFLAQKILWC